MAKINPEFLAEVVEIEKCLDDENYVWAIFHLHVWYAQNSAYHFWPRIRFFVEHGDNKYQWAAEMWVPYLQAKIMMGCF